MTERMPMLVALVRLKRTTGVDDTVHIVEVAEDDEQLMVTTLCGIEHPRDALEPTMDAAGSCCMAALREIERAADPLAPAPIVLE
jgi:hypothetical protein